MITTETQKNEIHEALKRARAPLKSWGQIPGSDTFSQFEDAVQKGRVTWDERNPLVIVKDVSVVTIFYGGGGKRLILKETKQVFRNGFEFKHKLDGSVADTMLHDETPSVAALRAVQKLSQTKPEFNSVSLTTLTSKGIADSIPHLHSHQYPGLYMELIRRKFEFTIEDNLLFLPKYTFTEINKVTYYEWVPVEQ